MYGEERSIGRIVKKNGFVKKTNINCESEECNRDNKRVYPGDRIVTGKKSSAAVLLDEGTAIVIDENSDVIIFSIMDKKNKTLTDIYAEYGKLKVIQQNDFLNVSLVIKTRTAVIKSVCATINIISAGRETGIFTYKGETGFANIDPSIIEAYAIKSGYESYIRRGEPPTDPVEVDVTLRSSWLERHFLSKNRDRILIYNRNGGPADWFFIQKK